MVHKQPHHRMNRILALHWIVLGAALIVHTPSMASATPFHGVDFDPIYRAGTNELPLYGIGLCRVYFMKVYVGALYLQPGIDSGEVLGDVSKRLELHYLRDIPAKILIDHTREGMEANLSASAFARIQNDLNRLNGLFLDVVKGDEYALTYVTGKGLRLERNGKQTGIFEDPVFARALFGVWLGRVPLNQGFKEDVLTPIRDQR